MASFTLRSRSRGGPQGSAWPPLLLGADLEEGPRGAWPALLLGADLEEGPRGEHGLLYS